jgi:DcmR-like sensory protein
MATTLPPVRLAGRTISQTNHICAFFNSREEQNKVLMPFFKEGYDQGEKLFHVVDSGLHREHRCACQQGGIDVEKAEASGQLEIQDWEHSYLQDGYFDTDRMIRTVEEMLHKNRPRFERIRVTGNMEWALQKLPGVTDVIEYETKLNYVLPKYPDAFVCVYDLNRHSGSIVMDILRTHPMVIIAGVLQENPLYVPPDEFMQELRQRKGKRASPKAAAVAGVN